ARSGRAEIHRPFPAPHLQPLGPAQRLRPRALQGRQPTEPPPPDPGLPALERRSRASPVPRGRTAPCPEPVPRPQQLAEQLEPARAPTLWQLAVSLQPEPALRQLAVSLQPEPAPRQLAVPLQPEPVRQQLVACPRRPSALHRQAFAPGLFPLHPPHPPPRRLSLPWAAPCVPRP